MKAEDIHIGKWYYGRISSQHNPETMEGPLMITDQGVNGWWECKVKNKGWYVIHSRSVVRRLYEMEYHPKIEARLGAPELC